MKHRLLYYAKREIKMRPRAFLAVFCIMTVCFTVILNLYLTSYGHHLAKIEKQAEYYHIRLPYLTESEYARIPTLDYVESVYSTPMADGLRAYIRLKDGTPATLETQCVRAIRDLSLDSKPEYRDFTRWLPVACINDQYLKLALTPHFAQFLPSLLFVFALSCFAILFTLQLKNNRSAGEYGCMLTFGLTKREITLLSLLEINGLLFLSFPVSFLISTLILLLQAIYTQTIYQGARTGIIFAIPWAETLLILGILSVIINIFQFFKLRQLLKEDIVDLLGKRKMLSIASPAHSSKRTEQPDKLHLYRTLHLLRSFRNHLRCIGKTLALFSMALFLMIMSISYNEERYITSDIDFHLSPGDGPLTESVVEEIRQIPYIEKIVTGDTNNSGSYMIVEIYCLEGTVDQCEPSLQSIASVYGFGCFNRHQEIIALHAEANLFAPYYLFQSLLMFACGLLVIAADLRYELHCRREEFAVIRAVGYPLAELRKLTAVYPIQGIAGYVLSVVTMFAVLGLGFHLVPSRLVLYPFVVILVFGALDYFLHYKICRDFLREQESEELSAVLSGQ